MKAVVYQGAHKVTVENVPDPKIEGPRDAIIRVTSTCICGSDLHVYDGSMGAEPGLVLGHESLGIVEEVGPGCVAVKAGDRVSVPFAAACGFCPNCQRGLTSLCLTTAPNGAGAYYGNPGMPYRGGQAEYLRVPFADFNCLQLPRGDKHEQDFALLSDVFPTGHQGAERADVNVGESVAVFGAGPIGIAAAYSALLRGAAVVYVVDRIPERLALAEKIGAVPVDFSKGDPAEQIMQMRGGEGVQKSIEAVGYSAQDASGKQNPAITLTGCIKVTNPGGRIGCVGVFAPQGEAGYTLPFGAAWFKGLTIETGGAHVHQFSRYLRDLIIAGRATLSVVVSHQLPIDQAPNAYEKFARRADGYTKVILKP